VHIVEAASEGSLVEGLTGARRDVPPSFRCPSAWILIPDRNADAARCRIAEFEVGYRRRSQTDVQSRERYGEINRSHQALLKVQRG
jgi:hypothetical protein